MQHHLFVTQLDPLTALYLQAQACEFTSYMLEKNKLDCNAYPLIYIVNPTMASYIHRQTP